MPARAVRHQRDSVNGLDADDRSGLIAVCRMYLHVLQVSRSCETQKCLSVRLSMIASQCDGQSACAVMSRFTR